MKHTWILFFCVLLPQYVLAQYCASCFTFSESEQNNFTALNACVSYGDSTMQLPDTQACSGLFVSGNVELIDSIDGYARITLKDINGFEYLVYEIYPILTNSSRVYFHKTGLESSVLNQIQPQSIRIETHYAYLQIDSVYFVYNNYPSKTFLARSESNRKAQCDYIADRLNNLLETKGKTWRAGTTSVSNLTYEEKKDMFGGNIPVLYGFEYYKDGVFVMPSFEKCPTNNRFILEGDFVPEWDWRNRHGQNWLTPIKNQGNCGSCWAFAAAGLFEAYINLFYNQHLDYDLSEQELISCANAGSCSGGFYNSAFYYMKNTGIVPEACFPYSATNNSCDNKCNKPSETLMLEDYMSYSNNDLILKQLLFKAPIDITLCDWNHAVLLIGYKDIQHGENIFGMLQFESDTTLEKQTAWIIKNSWGSEWGHNGFGYILTNPDDIVNVCSVFGLVFSQFLDDDDIVCEDSDGDGFYNWGLGSKPANCPSWIPDEEDGDDSDYNKGPINEFGFLQDIIPDELDTIFITSDTIFSTGDFTIHQHVVVCNNATMTIENHLTCYSGVSLTVMEGASLVVSEGTLDNVILKMQPGGNLTLSNLGTIIHEKESSFEIPKGAFFLNTNGSIIYN